MMNFMFGTGGYPAMMGGWGVGMGLMMLFMWLIVVCWAIISVQLVWVLALLIRKWGK